MLKLKEPNDLSRGQAEFKVEEDLSSYGGKWVAIRDGRVVASDLSPKLLKAHRNVRDSDVLAPIPESRGGYFVA